jgi:hypothetical protein
MERITARRTGANLFCPERNPLTESGVGNPNTASGLRHMRLMLKRVTRSATTRRALDIAPFGPEVSLAGWARACLQPLGGLNRS